MTAAERALLQGVEALYGAFSTRSTFTVDGSATVFSGVISQERYDTDPAAGGRSVDMLLRIVAPTAQFTTAGVTLSAAKYITFQGRKWVIDNLPYRESTEGFITIECSNPNRK